MFHKHFGLSLGVLTQHIYANTDLDDYPQTVKKSQYHFMWDIKVFIFIFTDTLEVHPQTDKTESACAHKKAVARGKTSY